MITIPKSGTVYMSAMFRQSLGIGSCSISSGYFPSDLLYVDAMSTFWNGGYYASSHADASPHNLQLLDAFVPRWIVHVRDPRSVVLSWVHHVERLAQEGRFVLLFNVCPVPPPELHAYSFERRVDWHIDNFLPYVLKWMVDWIDAAESRPDRIMLTEFAALKEDEQGYSRSVLDFVGTESGMYQHSPPEKTMRSHFRTGTYDEWRRSFTSRQIEAISSAIPRRLLDRFGWTSA